MAEENRGRGRSRGLGRTLLEQHITMAHNNKQVCLVVYIDLKSAFDTIDGKRLLTKLIRKGIKGNIIKWLSSYFENREIKVILEGISSDKYDIKAGTPQGAVLSPILFNLMLIDIPQMQRINLLIYADDITITTTDTNPISAKIRIEKYLKLLKQWADEWGLIINPEKTRAQHFTKNTEVKYPEIEFLNSKIKYTKVQKILGILVDSPSLTMRQHTDYLKMDCLHRLNIMKVLSSTKWGASSNILRNFYKAYIRSKIDYGSIIYARAAPSNLKKIDTIQNAAMRLILGARKTTPIPSLQAETHIPPLEVHRGYLTIKQYIKLKYNPEGNQTTKILQCDEYFDRVLNPLKSFTARVRNELFLLQMDQIDRSPTTNLSTIPPWIELSKYIKLVYDQPVNDNNSFDIYTRENYPNYKQLYTDGSKTLINNIPSVGFGIFEPEKQTKHVYKLKPVHSVLAAELCAIQAALVKLKQYNKDAIVFTDSKTSLQLIKGESTTHIKVVNTIRKLLIDLNKQNRVILHWVKAHCGIQGNEEADKAANLAHCHNTLGYQPLNITSTDHLSKLKSKVLTHWEEQWKSTTGSGAFLRSLREGIKKDDITLALAKRKHQVIIHRLRTGHAGVKAHLHRIKREEDDECEEFQERETIEHYLLKCRLHEEARSKLITKLQQIGVPATSLKNLLGLNPQYHQQQADIIQATINFVEETGMTDQI